MGWIRRKSKIGDGNNSSISEIKITHPRPSLNLREGKGTLEGVSYKKEVRVDLDRVIISLWTNLDLTIKF